MPKFNVYFLTTQVIWEDVEAKNEDDAIKKCHLYSWESYEEPTQWVAYENEEM